MHPDHVVLLMLVWIYSLVISGYVHTGNCCNFNNCFFLGNNVRQARVFPTFAWRLHYGLNFEDKIQAKATTGQIMKGDQSWSQYKLSWSFNFCSENKNGHSVGAGGGSPNDWSRTCIITFSSERLTTLFDQAVGLILGWVGTMTSKIISFSLLCAQP